MNPPSLSLESPGSRMWPTVSKLLRLRLVIWVGGFRRASLRGKIGYIALGLVIITGLGFAFGLSWMLLRLLRSPEIASMMGEATALLESVPVMIVTSAFVGILFTSFGLLLQALYLAGDMDFLLSAPVTIRAVFVSKLLQAILPNFSLVLLFGLPVLFGLGASAGYNLLYYPLVPIMLGLMALAAAGLSSLLVMAVVRIFPARRVAEVLGLLVGVSSLLCSQSGQLANWADVSGQQAASAISVVTRLNSPWSPLAWAGRSLVAIGEGQWGNGVGLFLLTGGLAGGLFLVSLGTAEKLYYSGWASLQGQALKKKARRQARPSEQPKRLGQQLVVRWVPAQVRAMLLKDWLVLRRDLRNMSHLITPLILGVIYAIMLVRSGGEPPAGRGEAPEWFMQGLQVAMVYGHVGISLFVSWTLLSRLAMMGFSQEGASYWMVKSAPVQTSRLLLAKFLVAYLPSLALGWAFVLVIALLQRSPWAVSLYGLGVVGLATAGSAGINLAFGVAGANMDWDDPRKMQRGVSGCLGALASAVYLIFGLAIFFLPPVLTVSLGWGEASGQLIGLLLGGAFSLACAVLPPWLVRKRVSRLGES